MDRDTLLAGLDFSRARLLSLLATIEKSAPNSAQALAWRPGPGRAHIAWQAMHCAATHDKYLNVVLRGGKPQDEALVRDFAGGSTPDDAKAPDLATIRSTLETHFAPFRAFIASVTPEQLEQKMPSGRTVGENIILFIWHEAHHQGQIHLTWNLYKGAHGIA